MAGIDSETISRLGLMEEYHNRGPSPATTTLPPVIHLLSSILEKWIQKNETMFSKVKHVITIFHGSKPPSLSIRSYVERIFKYGRCSTSCFVVGYIYMDRFVARTGTYLTSLNAHRILITSIMLAAKFLDDECHNNAYYAKIGGVSIAEMNRMEMKFLFSSDFRLHVSVPVFRNYCWKLEKGGGQNLIDLPIHSRRQKQG